MDESCHFCFSSNTYNNDIDDVLNTSGQNMSVHNVLIASCCEVYHPDEIIKEILSCDKLPPGKPEIEDIVSYDWHINTKYYTADVKLCSTTSKTIGNAQFAELVQAVVIYFDSNQSDSFIKVKSWLPYIKEMSPAVQMLVCQNCLHNQATSRTVVQKWCLDNDFELVELQPEQNSDEDDDFDFQETTGIKRIIQALHAHMWPNLVLKETKATVSPYMRQLMEEQAAEKSSKDKTDTVNITQNMSNTSELCKHDKQSDTCGEMCNTENGAKNETNIDTHGIGTFEGNSKSNVLYSTSGLEEGIQTKHSKQSEMKKTQKEKLLDELLPADDMAVMQAICSEEDEGESFEQLFSKFRLMKEKADSLPVEEKKQYAEKVAVAFWKAIGGDEDEIDGLSD